ncbi:carbohydrate ABC transporter, N-acetylglucosamine/diacetylchitobiose-binding protein [Kribbella qitaiheensis]|uniref:Carbohydrate ABC transporter, N-acetylglucosamine/diacetylchitobiose-binding protein n=1 Tax=Kribbella qitaiheensis TaxID=1544730 RepID=A0A7G6X3H7_9ACTN|nr:N-acetylglucosamine/diacetylchitobiose ABC transporter substrate-binding protein [Kribbella qitaiheensis]QNE20792.1 carbohydrate ABC transporter, N-acetylglucosamine/diacetylchitobiose-binding protein [Kribbella qitaiheensis]
MLRRRTLLQGVVASALVTGCSGGKPATGPVVSAGNPFGVNGERPLEVVVAEEWGGFGAPQYRKKYAKAVVTTTPTKQLKDLLESRFAAGSPPDVVLNVGDKALPVAHLVAEDQLWDLGELLKAPSWSGENATVQDAFLPGLLEAGRYDGTLRTINYVATVYGLWYSTQLFQKHDWDVPRTWAELLALGIEMKAAGVGPFAYAGVHPYYVFEAVLTLAAKTGGHDVVKRIDNLEDGAWKDESITRAITAFGELTRRGLLAKGTTELDHLASQTQLMKSKAGLLPCGNWLENEMKAATPANFGLSMFGIPPLDTSAALPRGLHVAPTAPLVVPKKAKNREGGVDYLRAMLSKEVAAQVTAESNQLTVVRGSADGLEISTALRSARDLLTAAGDQAITWYFADWYPELGRTAGELTGQFLAGGIRADEWTGRIQAAADKVKQDHGVTKYRRN